MVVWCLLVVVCMVQKQEVEWCAWLEQKHKTQKEIKRGGCLHAREEA
jgi:hypothetical protein